MNHEHAPLADLSDGELVRRHVEGVRGAFEEIVTRHRNRVYAVSLRICGRQEDALDVVQDVFVAAYRKLSSFRQEALLTTWLHRLAVNASLDLARRKSRRDHPSLETIADVADAAAGPEDLAIRADRAAAVQRALRAITPEYRAVVVLHDLQDLDYAQVAEVLGVPLGTVKSRIHRARIELAKLLGHLEPAEGERPSKVVTPDE